MPSTTTPLSRTLRSLVLALLVVVLAVPLAAGSAVAGRRWVWPLDPVPPVVRYFEPPQNPYGPGHRGIDLAGTVGEPVLAIGPGTVAFAGSVAGRGVVVVDHGGLRSTYQPVAATVPVGLHVSAGDRIGVLELVHSHCLPDACLHLGVLRAGRYLDPLTLLGALPVRLKPLAGLPAPPRAPSPPRAPPDGRLRHVDATYPAGAHIGTPYDLLAQSVG